MELRFTFTPSPLPYDVIRGDCIGVYTAYNPDVVEVFKCTPNSIWSSEFGCWDVRKCMVNVFIKNIRNMAKLKGHTCKFYMDKTLSDSPPEHADLDHFKFITPPYKFQREGVEFCIRHKHCFIGDEPGSGKSLSDDSLIYYEDGPRLIRDAKIGDMIYGKDGKLHKIEGVYPQGELDIYKVTMWDGSSVKCSLDHIWRVKKGYNGKYKDCTLKDLLSAYDDRTVTDAHWVSLGHPKYCIPKCDPVVFSDDAPNIGVEFDSIEHRIIYLMQLMYCVSQNSKNIVQLDKSCKFMIYTSDSYNECLRTFRNAKNLVSVVNSLGGSYYIDVLDRHILSDDYINVFVFPDKIIPYIKSVCESLSIKFSEVNYDQLNIHTASRNYLRNLVKTVFSKNCDCVGIRSIEKLSKASCTCIKIDSEDSLFLTNDYIVTHNTKQLIDYSRYLRYKHDVRHVLVICGVNGNKFNWVDEVAIHSEFTAHILGSRRSRRTGKLNLGGLAETLTDLRNPPEDFFYIINIEKLRGGHQKRKRGQRRSIAEFPVAQAIQALIDKGEIGLVAVDEIHKVKQPTSLQAQALLWLKCERQVGMSGTLVVNGPLDLYVPFKWMGFECRDYFHFQNRYAVKDSWGSVVGYQHAQEMIDILSVYQIRRLRKDVLELPPKISTVEYVELSTEERKFYRLIQEGLSSIYNTGELVKFDAKYNMKDRLLDNLVGEDNPLVLSLRLRQVTADTSLISTRPVPSSKMKRMEELVDSILSLGEKCIIFSNWSSVTAIVRDRLSKYNPAYITGDVNAATRASEISRFQNDNSCRIIIGTCTALGTGFTLTAATNVIFMDEPWTKASKVQCEDRAYRVGTSSAVQIITLIAKDTVDEHVHSIVENKGAIADLIVDGVVNPSKKQQFVNLILGCDQFARQSKKKADDSNDSIVTTSVL